MGSPKVAAAAQHNLYEIYSALAVEGALVQRITSAHPERKLAKVAEHFDEMLKHPLAKKYLKVKPELFVSEAEAGLGNVYDACVKSPRIVDVSRGLVEHLDEKELKAALGHELGHLIAGHMHPQNATIFALAGGMTNQRRERIADQIGTLLSGEGSALAGALRKIVALNVPAMEQASARPPRLLRALFSRTNADGAGRAYPSLRQRVNAINKVAKQLETPEDEKWAERVMASRLDALHDKLR
jgi:Zn-dependent protease with chaperone function